METKTYTEQDLHGLKFKVDSNHLIYAISKDPQGDGFVVTWPGTGGGVHYMADALLYWLNKGSWKAITEDVVSTELFPIF